MNKHFSLRKYLLIWITIPVLGLVIISLIIGFLFTWHEIEEVYDAQLAHNSKVLYQLVEHEIHDDKAFSLGIEQDKIEHKYERNLGFRVWYNQNLVTQSTNTTHFGEFKAPPGFSTQEIDGHSWRFFVMLTPSNDIVIETSEKFDIRYELITQLMLSQIIPALFFVPILLFIVWIIVRKSLSPLIAISAEVKNRKSDDFSAVGKEQHIVDEIEPLISGLNQLLGRIGETFQHERQFTDYAAHELRTPLAAMKTQAQVLLRKTKELPEYQAGLNNLLASVERATALVEQLLSLARVQNQVIVKNKVALSDLIEQKISELENKAKSKNIRIIRDIKPQVIIEAHEETFGILLHNLIDNSIKYSFEDSEIQIRLTENTFNIIDTGPGISDEHKTLVFDRFVRVDTRRQIGSGLGLAIVKWIAQSHHMNIHLRDNAPSGLHVEIELRSER